MNRMKVWLAAFALLCGFAHWFAVSDVADASVIRHDRNQSLYLNLGSSARYESVGLFSGSTPDFDYTGSGVVIAPNWVLTAGHMVDDATSLSFWVGGKSYKASGWIAHPNWNGDLSTGWDIALVRFDKAITGVTPATRYFG